MLRPITLTLALFASSYAEGADEQSWVVPAAGDNPLVVRGWVGQPETFTTSLRLTNPREEAVQLRLDVPVDLKLKDGDAQIRRDLVTLDRDVTLQPGESKNILVKVAPPTAPGEYTGQIELRPGAAGPPKGTVAPKGTVVVPFHVLARVVPKLKLASDAKRGAVQLTQTRWFLDRWLVSESEMLDKRPVQFENPVRVPVRLPW